MNLDCLPEQIGFDELTGALESVGIPITDQRLRSIHIEAQRVVLTYLRTDYRGDVLTADNEIATIEVTVDIRAAVAD